MTFASEDATARELTDALPKKPSETFVHRLPASVVFHTPPPVEPM
jgi:hypothetical protein